jgi:membrane associated rhomboid family serine protease
VFPLYDENRPLKRPYVNYGLIIVNVVVFFFFFLQDWRVMVEGFYIYGAIPAEILNGRRLWTLLTSMFIHGDIGHLVGNMVFLWIFGDNIEDSLGHTKYLAFYLLGGFFASFAHITSSVIMGYTNIIPYFTPNLDTPAVGASGAISAALGAYLFLYPRAKIRTLVFFFYIITIVSIPAFYYLGFWFIYQLLMGVGVLLGASSATAFWAHIGGYVYGMAIVKTFNVKSRMKPRLLARERPTRPITAPWRIRPLVDVLVVDDRVTVLANLPGVEEREIEIEVSERKVTISAEYRDIRFQRQVALPVSVIPEAKNVVYRNGVLTFTLYRAH